MEEKYTIYKLIDPTTNQVRYIGLTFNTLKQRLKSHINENSKTHKCFWIKKLKSISANPIIEPIEENISSYEEACLREIFFIEEYKNNGHDLTNSATGGNKNKKMSDETRRKMSDARFDWLKTNKMILSEESKKRISDSTKLRMQDPKEIEKLKISNKRYEDSKTEDQRLKDILVQNCKMVFQYDIDMNFVKKYPSTRNAEKVTGFNSTNIAKCCKRKVSTVGGFIWRYEGDVSPMKPKYLRSKD